MARPRAEFPSAVSLFWLLEAQGLNKLQGTSGNVVLYRPFGRRHGLVPDGGRGDGQELTTVSCDFTVKQSMQFPKVSMGTGTNHALFPDRMPTVVKDAVFGTATGEWEDVQLVQLSKLVQQAGEDPQAVLRNHGWNGTDPVVAMTARIDSETKRVLRSDYITAGLVYKFTGAVRGFGGYKPPEATWKNGTNVKISFEVKGEMLQWGCAAGKNVTPWLPLRDLDASVQFLQGRDARILETAQLATLGMDRDEWMGRLHIRFTLQHGDKIGTMHLSATVLHTTSLVLPAWADLANKPETVPGLVLKPRGTEVRHAVVQWLPVEERGQKIGLGRLPVLSMPPDITQVSAHTSAMPSVMFSFPGDPGKLPEQEGVRVGGHGPPEENHGGGTRQGFGGAADMDGEASTQGGEPDHQVQVAGGQAPGHDGPVRLV